MTYNDDLKAIDAHDFRMICAARQDLPRMVRFSDLTIKKLRLWCPMNKAMFEKMIQELWAQSESEGG